MLFLPSNNPMRLKFIFIFTIIAFLSLHSQNRTIDSLISLTKNAPQDTVKAAALDELFWTFTAIDISNAQKYAQELIEFSQKVKFKKGEAKGYTNFGSSFYLQGDYIKAVENYERASAISTEIGDRSGIAAAINNIAVARQQQGNFLAALKSYLDALKIFEELKEEKRAALATSNIGVIYYERKEFARSLDYALKALAIWEKLKVKAQISICSNNVANNYSSLKKEDKAIFYYEKALENGNGDRDPYNTGRIYHNLGMIFMDRKDYKKAESLLTRSIPLKESVGDKEGIASGYYALGVLYSKTDRLNEAIVIYKKAEMLAKEIGSKQALKWVYSGLREALYQQKKFVEAFEYSDRYDAMRDTLFSESEQEQMAEMQTKYETEKKEKENELLLSQNKVHLLEIDNQKTQRNILIIVFVFLLFTGFVVYTRFRLKARNKMLEEKNLRNIAVIKGQEEEKIKLSKELHDGVGPLLSLIKLNASSIQTTEENKKVLEDIKGLASEGMKEVRNISHALMPSVLEKSGLKSALEEFIAQVEQSSKIKLNFIYNVNREPGQNVQLNLYRIVQEAINNSLRYANAKNISVELKDVGQKTGLSIKDDGSGFILENIKEGNGLTNMRSRVDLINGELKIESGKGRGTLIIVKV
jgi:two-component system NarL family sensor kinase